MDLMNFDLPSATNNFFSAAELNIENKERSNLLPWKGQFSPQLIESLLEIYSKPGFKILDPFLGSGTILIESARKGLEATGVELNPAAFKMALIYTLCNLSELERKKLVDSIEIVISDFVLNADSVFDFSSSSEILFSNLLSIGHILQNENEKILFEILVLLLDPKEKEITISRLENSWKRLRDLVMELPEVRKSVKAFNGDSRDLSFLNDREFDLVVTSPPYINVFNYHQQKRFAVEALGSEILSVARSEIGSNRKHRQNRFLTVTQYCLDMSLVLQQVSKKSKICAKIIFVVGRESNVRKTNFYNSKIIADIARVLGLPLIDLYEREFKNRFGQIIKEDLLIFENAELKLFDESEIREIAKSVLNDALERAPQDSISDLNSAIKMIEKVQASEYYKPNMERG